MDDPARNENTPPAEPPLEGAMARIEKVVLDLEQGQLPLTDALARYEEGVKLLKHCYGLLSQAERRIELVSGVDSSGRPIAKPLDEADSGPADEKMPTRRTRPQRRQGAKPPAGGDDGPAGEMDAPTTLF